MPGTISPQHPESANFKPKINTGAVNDSAEKAGDKNASTQNEAVPLDKAQNPAFVRKIQTEKLANN